VSYTNDPVVFSLGDAATLARTGRTGIVTSYGISPALPSGLFFNVTTGGISGTPSALSTAGDYIITATGPGGSGRDTVTIAVTTPAPSVSYTNDTVAFNLYETASLSRTGRTGIVRSYSISPALPSGLFFNTTSGVVSGTAGALSPATDYIITVTGPGGTGRDTVIIAVTTPAPTVSYVNEPQAFSLNQPVTLSRLGRTGIVVSYAINPALPAGLYFNGTTGQIQGTPGALRAATDYVITVTGPGGTGRDTVNIAVTTPAPTVSYADTAYAFVVGQDIAPVIRTGNTGIVTSYGITPVLPSGLSFNTTTGRISGRPSVISSAGAYVITANGPGGSGSDTITLSVLPNPPVLTFAADTVHFTTGMPITSFRPTNSGGTIVNWSISLGSNGVSLSTNTGLLFNPTTGFIYGTPVYASVARTYTVMANGLGGSADTAVIVISSAAPGAKLAVGPETFTVRVSGETARYALRLPPIDGEASQVTVTIHDPAGRSIWNRAVDPRTGIRTLMWDGRNNAGGTVSSGLYLVRVIVAQGGRSATVMRSGVALDR
jgi:hypothetical protein